MNGGGSGEGVVVGYGGRRGATTATIVVASLADGGRGEGVVVVAAATVGKALMLAVNGAMVIVSVADNDDDYGDEQADKSKEKGADNEEILT